MKKIAYTPPSCCPHCGGLHLGTRFDACPYIALAVDASASEEQRHNAAEWLRLYKDTKEAEKK